MSSDNLELLTIEDLAKILQRGSASIRADVKAGRFPQPIATWPRHRRWLKDDVIAHLKANSRVETHGDRGANSKKPQQD